VNVLNGHRERVVNVLNEYSKKLCEFVKWTQGDCVNVLNEYRESV